MGKSYLKIQHLSLANFQAAKNHFEQVIRLKPDSADAYAYLGQLYYGRGLWDLAIENFHRALELGTDAHGDVRPDLQVVMLLLAKAHSFRGELDKSEHLASEARAVYAARVASQPRDDIDSRIILADACMFLEDFEGASKVLNEGLVLNDEEPSLRAALARFNVAWADALAQSESEDDTRGRRFELLSAALLLDPNYAPIFDRMMKILAEKNETSEAAKEFLLGNVTGGPTMGLSHLLLGSSAFAADDAATAAYHLERAYELLPNAYIVTNNLAWFLAFKDPPDLDRGLDLINNVLKRAPNDPPMTRDSWTREGRSTPSSSGGTRPSATWNELCSRACQGLKRTRRWRLAMARKGFRNWSAVTDSWRTLKKRNNQEKSPGNGFRFNGFFLFQQD
jgi:tetratricopeptide (TPR) repeat protein